MSAPLTGVPDLRNATTNPSPKAALERHNSWCACIRAHGFPIVVANVELPMVELCSVLLLWRMFTPAGWLCGVELGQVHAEVPTVQRKFL